MRLFLTSIMFIFFSFSSSFSHADKALLKKNEVRHFINFMVKNHGFKRKDLVEIFQKVQFQPQIIESMEKPYEQKTWDVYKNLFLTQNRVDEGINFWRKNKAILQKVQDEYGVPAHIIVAILGVETLYGQKQGQYKVIDALSTLAFYYPKRASFFTKELKEYLLLCKQQGFAPDYLVGSYAGAIGKPQFMPSSYRTFAIDYNGKGKSDLVNEDHDVIASVANYFKKHGWIYNDEIAYPAQITNVDHNLQSNTRTALYDFNELIKAGITPLAKLSEHHPQKAGLIVLATKNGEEYWLAFPNFYVITRYNNSPQYALVVYLLASELHNKWIAEITSKRNIIAKN